MYGALYSTTAPGFEGRFGLFSKRVLRHQAATMQRKSRMDTAWRKRNETERRHPARRPAGIPERVCARDFCARMVRDQGDGALDPDLRRRNGNRVRRAF